MALGAEYEYANFGSSRLYYNDGTPMDNQNEYTKSTLKGQHTLRVGMEIPMASVVGKKVESMSMILMWPLMWRTECISVSL